MTSGARVLRNLAAIGGGGIHVEGGVLLANGATVSHNRAGYRGGGIHAQPDTTVILEDCLVDANVAGTGVGAHPGLQSPSKFNRVYRI